MVSKPNAKAYFVHATQLFLFSKQCWDTKTYTLSINAFTDDVGVCEMWQKEQMQKDNERRQVSTDLNSIHCNKGK